MNKIGLLLQFWCISRMNHLKFSSNCVLSKWSHHSQQMVPSLSANCNNSSHHSSSLSACIFFEYWSYLSICISAELSIITLYEWYEDEWGKMMQTDILISFSPDYTIQMRLGSLIMQTHPWFVSLTYQNNVHCYQCYHKGTLANDGDVIE